MDLQIFFGGVNNMLEMIGVIFVCIGIISFAFTHAMTAAIYPFVMLGVITVLLGTVKNTPKQK